MNDHADWLRSADSNNADLPPELEQLLLSHEPSALGDRISRELDDYTVAFIASKNGKRSPAGSGTLVSFRNSKYILTAAHVWHGDDPENGLKNADTILIPIKEGEPKRLTIGPDEIVPFGPEIPEEWNQWGPDLVMLSLPPDRIGSIQAVGRSFYNLSKKEEDNVEGVQMHFLVGAPARRGNFTANKAIPEMQAMLIWKATGPYLRSIGSDENSLPYDAILKDRTVRRGEVWDVEGDSCRDYEIAVATPHDPQEKEFQFSMCINEQDHLPRETRRTAPSAEQEGVSTFTQWNAMTEPQLPAGFPR